MDERQARAVEEARLLLDARQELYGESDPTTFDAMLQLGRVLRDAGELREAERVLTASLSLQNRSAETNGSRVRWTEFNLAIVLDRLGEHEAARRLWESVSSRPPTATRASTASCPGRRPPTWPSRCANSAATATNSRSGYGCSKPPRRSLGPDSAETLRAQIDLAQTHRHLGNHELALGLFTEALAGLERNGGDQRTILYQKWAIATELVALKRSKEAAQMFDQVVAGAVEHLEPDDPFRRSAVRQRRGYWLLGKFSEVRPQGPAGRHARQLTPGHGSRPELLALDVDGVLLDPWRGGRGPWQLAFGERFGVDAAAWTRPSSPRPGRGHRRAAPGRVRPG